MATGWSPSPTCFLLCIAASEYEDGPGNLWAAKGEIKIPLLLTLVKLLLLHFACNAPFRGTSQEEFEAHFAALSSGHLRDLNNSSHKVAQE